MPDSPVLYSFVETPVFTKRITEMASPETLEAIQAELLEEPERWPVVRARLPGSRHEVPFNFGTCSTTFPPNVRSCTQRSYRTARAIAAQ